jgi:hypothetical protein
MRAVTGALGREVHPRAQFNAKSAVARAVLRHRLNLQAAASY